MKEETTLDQLAVMIAKGFESIDARFGEVDARLESIDQRFDAVDKRFGVLESRMTERFREVRQDTRELQHIMETNQRRGDLHEEEIADLSRRVLLAEQKLGTVV